MINGTAITGSEAINEIGLQALIGRQCVAISAIYADGSSQMVLGKIVRAEDCVIDEPDDSVFYVEYWSLDDWYVTGVAPDEQVMLLSEEAA